MNNKFKKFLITLIAIIGYGGWALYSNWDFDALAQNQMVAIRAGLIQGGYSGLLTLINIIILENLFTRFNSAMSYPINMLTTLLCTTLLQYSIIIPVHLINGTPHILITLLPGFFIGTTFSFVYLLSIRQNYYPIRSV